jgi:hypothetical protein
MTQLHKTAILAIALCVLDRGPLVAETIWIARAGGAFLSSFDSAAPGTLLNDVAVSGLVAGDAIYGIDFHPVSGMLYGYAGASGRLYTLDTTTGVATAVGVSQSVPNIRTGMSFNGLGTEIRIVHQAGINLSGTNFRIDPSDGTLIANDTPTNEDGLNGIAYDSVPTVYALEDGTGNTYTIGSVGGAPIAPSTGLVSLVGASGIFTTQQYNFDISDTTGTAYVDDGGGGAGGTLNLWSLNLTTGVGTYIGTIDNGLSSSRGLAIQGVPEPIAFEVVCLLSFAAWPFIRRRAP